MPWLLAAAVLVVYGLTLNHWVTLVNLVPVGEGFRLDLAAGSSTIPLSFLVTYPFHWLPTAQIPLALNVFSAVCAA